MRRYWAIVGAAIVVVIVLAAIGFFSKFTPQDWTTFVIAGVALLGTLFTIFRGLVGKPHWQKVTLEPRVAWTQSAGGDSPVTKSHSELRFMALNGGPGVAERVEYEFRLPGLGWQKPSTPLRQLTYDRHQWLRLSLIGWDGTADNVPPGRYKVRLRWSALPDTSRRPRRTFAFNITAPFSPTKEAPDRSGS